ncbi:hypothetical protein QJS10_CPB17g00663 [Acorus calamus]|uniref:Glycosyltransferase subfamily 4-like N-terminal domain-containing protein n=1 Tax=Acorus calamus TaxID=4465 RepID=A0AAV9CT12_ACOCL|nr:hypothetical protein QJS10_CPB17g00663 [Acorus calamus]
MEIKMKGRAAVVVLGDIGRSPQMQYHALSLASQAGMEVDIVADGGTDPHMAVIENLSIHLHKMRPIHLRRLSNISRPLILVLKTFIQFVQLIWFLCVKIPRPDVFIVQNPPSVPTLAAVKLASWLRRSKFVIDWHNFGYTLLGLSHGRSHPFVKIYHWCELFFGRMAHGTLCVTRAMKHELDQNWGIKATVLYDQPPEFFHPTSLEEKHELFYRLQKELCHSHGILDCVSFEMRGLNDSSSREGNESDSTATLFSTKVGHDIFLKPNRPALVVSSTSWTSDEDFGLLLEAAVLYDRRAAAALKEDDMAEVEMLWSDIRSADLGVCLHTSSSGLDLPMKVVDMFGCGLPVCAVSYSWLF